MIAYKETEKSQSNAIQDVCYCCQEKAEKSISACNFPGAAKIAVCGKCSGAFITIGGYLVFECVIHGHTDIAGMAYYFDSLEKYNKDTGEKKRGVRVKPTTDWRKETDKLRNSYQAKLF